MYKYGYIYTEFPLFLWAHAEQQSLDKGQHKGCKLADMSRTRVQWQASEEMSVDTRKTVHTETGRDRDAKQVFDWIWVGCP